MPRHRPMWLELAEQQYLDMPTELLGQVDARLSQLVDDPIVDPAAAYDERSDQWSIPVHDHGFLFYAVVTHPPTVIVLRLVVDLG